MQLMRFQENIYEKIMYNLNEDNLVLLYGPLGCGKSKLINEHFKKDYSSYFEFKEIDITRPPRPYPLPSARG